MALVEMSLSNIHSGHPNLETSTVCSLLFKRKMIKKYIYISIILLVDITHIT